MKRSSIMRIATIAMAVCLIMSCAVFGSVAKYTSNASGSDSISVAKWSIKFDATDIATTNDITFNLFDGVEKVAPGSEGSFTATIKNDSDVAAKIEVDMTSQDNGKEIPVQYSLTGEDGSWKDSLVDLIADFNLDAGAEKEIEIFWKWTTGSDEADTAVGIAAVAGNVNIEVGMTVTATQVD